MNNKAMANFFYEQVAGCTAGHMAMIPNNPTLFALMKVVSKSASSPEACTRNELAEFLAEVADELKREPF